MAETRTWADGYGVWHAQVRDTKDSAQVAKRAIMRELRQRESNVSPRRVTVQCVDANPHHDTVTYAEEF